MNFKRYILIYCDHKWFNYNDIDKNGIEYIKSFSTLHNFFEYMGSKISIENRSSGFIRWQMKERGHYNFEGYIIIDSEHSDHNKSFTQNIREIIRDKRLKKLLGYREKD